MSDDKAQGWFPIYPEEQSAISCPRCMVSPSFHWLKQLESSRGIQDAASTVCTIRANRRSRHDFAGVANLAGKRRFELASHDSTVSVSLPTQPLRFAPPVTCPGNIPRNYTLYEDLLIVLDGLESATLLQHSPTELRRKEFTHFVESLNEDLIRTVVPYPNHTTPSRRYLIEDSYRLAALIYISAICGERMKSDWDNACKTFLDDLSSSILDINSDWGYTIEMILRLVMRGGRVRSQENIYYTVQIMNFSIPMDWHEWKGVRDALFGYLINAKICAGSHQDFWVCTMDII
jgi:hypothetical protein